MGQRIVVVLPAYRAAATLERTYRALPHDLIDQVLLVDDASADPTVRVAVGLGIDTFVHVRNLGYGANQKTCYREALRHSADVVIMVHPDYQYEPRLVAAMAAMVASGVYDVVLGSRILGSTSPLDGGMPLYKYVANRTLTLLQNIAMGTKMSEFHSGFRAFSKRALTTLPLAAASNDFVFDNEMLVQAVAAKLSLGEISCPTRYAPESSSIGLGRSVRYGLGVVATILAYRLWRLGVYRGRLFDPTRTLDDDTSYYRHVEPGAPGAP